MLAAVVERYGGPEAVEVREIPAPRPGPEEVLIRVRASTVTSADARIRGLRMPPGFGFMARPMFGLVGPRRPVLGAELAGEVVEVGSRVSRFAVGDAVFGMSAGMGAHAELMKLPATGALTHKPAGLSFEVAAALSFGGATALDFFRRGALAAGERVLVNGASGAVGSAAVQLAKHMGAEVTGVCSARNIELVRALGADHVVDHGARDFAATGERYDVIMDTVGNAPFARCRGSLASGGRLLAVIAGLGQLLGAPMVAWTNDARVIAGPAGERVEDLERLASLAERGSFRPVIERTVPLFEIAEAHALVDGGHKRGNVVVVMPGDAPTRARATVTPGGG